MYNRRMEDVIEGLFFVAVSFVCLVLVQALGCTPLAPPPTTPGSYALAAPDPVRCRALDDRSTWGAGVAAGSAMLAGSGGLGSLAADGNARVAFAVSALVAGAVSAASTIVAHESAAGFTRECLEAKP